MGSAADVREFGECRGAGGSLDTFRAIRGDRQMPATHEREPQRNGECAMRVEERQCESVSKFAEECGVRVHKEG
jgi:hypothetical protein